VAVALSACQQPAPVTTLSESAHAGACAWFGDARAGVLYFGISLREAGGDPRAELQFAGARAIGRFDLARERMLAPLAITPAPARSGVWDVLAHTNGWLYFTTFWEHAGRVDPATGRVEWFTSAGAALNELAQLPDGRVLASRYGRDRENKHDFPGYRGRTA
jgi:streptogramin lyase